MFAYAAFAVFLYRRERAVSWRTAAAVLALFGAALLSKEHTIVLPALLLLTDFWWNPGFSLQGNPRELEALRCRWRWAPLAVSRCSGACIMQASTAGIRHEGLHLVSIPVHAVPRDLRVYRDFRAAGESARPTGTSPSRGRFWITAPIFGLVALLALVAAGLALSPAIPAGVLRLLRVPAADGADLVDSARSRTRSPSAASTSRCSGCC